AKECSPRREVVSPDDASLFDPKTCRAVVLDIDSTGLRAGAGRVGCAGRSFLPGAQTLTAVACRNYGRSTDARSRRSGTPILARRTACKPPIARSLRPPAPRQQRRFLDELRAIGDTAPKRATPPTPAPGGSEV